jgi:hypothetical protein
VESPLDLHPRRTPRDRDGDGRRLDRVEAVVKADVHADVPGGSSNRPTAASRRAPSPRGASRCTISFDLAPVIYVPSGKSTLVQRTSLS